jgi:hypothetical protein
MKMEFFKVERPLSVLQARELISSTYSPGVSFDYVDNYEECTVEEGVFTITKHIDGALDILHGIRFIFPITDFCLWTIEHTTKEQKIVIDLKDVDFGIKKIDFVNPLAIPVFEILNRNFFMTYKFVSDRKVFNAPNNVILTGKFLRPLLKVSCISSNAEWTPVDQDIIEIKARVYGESGDFVIREFTINLDN